MSLLEKATCGCCDNVRQYISDHLDPSGDHIQWNSDAVTLYAEIEEMFVGVDEGPGITLAHLEEYITSLETVGRIVTVGEEQAIEEFKALGLEVVELAEPKIENGVEVTHLLAPITGNTDLISTAPDPGIDIEELMNTPVTEESEESESNIVDLEPTHAELKRAIRFADLLIAEATEKYGLPVVEDKAKVVVTIQSKHKKSRCLAWFSDPMSGNPYGWSNREQDEVYQEMNFTPEMFDRPGDEITAIVVHEKVHKWCTALGIQDCAKSGRHNGKFKKYAGYLGLVCKDPEDSYGYGYTSPSPELAERIENEFQPDITKFDTYRLPTRKGKPSDKLQKWECTPKEEGDDCPAVYTRGEQELSGVCHRCNEPFTRAMPKAKKDNLIKILLGG
jgi:hypothetical protein